MKVMQVKGNVVVGHMGDVLAEKINGKWESKDQTVLDFIAANKEKKPYPVPVEAKPKKETVATKIKKKVATATTKKKA